MIESFLKYLRYEKRASTHTVLAYENDLTQFETFISSNFQTTPEAADYGIIRSWIVSLTETGIEPISINRKIACLRTFYKFLVRQEAIRKDPMVKIRVLKTKKKLPGFVKETVMEEILELAATAPTETANEFDHSRDHLILELFYGTGIRLSELLYLTESNIDLKNRTIKVLGKRNKERIIPFNKNLVEVIKRYQQIRNRDVEMKDHGYLLVTSNGGPCYPMLVYQTVKKHLRKYDSIEKKSPHVLRHTYATHLLNKGAEINAVKDLLGHSSLAATQVYTHNSLEKLKKVFDQAHPKA